MAKLVVLMLIILVGIGSSIRKRRSVVGLFDLVDDFCDSKEACTQQALDDLIFYLSGEPFDEELDAGTSRETILLESIDDKCVGESSCLEQLYETLQDRVLDIDYVEDRVLATDYVEE